jgi:hypothetical protein
LLILLIANALPHDESENLAGIWRACMGSAVLTR